MMQTYFFVAQGTLIDSFLFSIFSFLFFFVVWHHISYLTGLQVLTCHQIVAFLLQFDAPSNCRMSSVYFRHGLDHPPQTFA
jgi:hypothetical protein